MALDEPTVSNFIEHPGWNGVSGSSVAGGTVSLQDAGIIAPIHDVYVRLHLGVMRGVQSYTPPIVQ